MEEQEHISLGVERQLEAVLKPSEELNLQQPQQLQFSCSPICSFANQKYNRFDLAERSKSTAKLQMLIIFYIVVMAVEIVGGLKSNSLAVLTDAAHLLSDIAGFAIALFTVWVSGWEATPRQSFGFNRLEVLGALLSVQVIWVISGILIFEAINRLLQQNEKVNGKLMFFIAAFGCIINFIMVVWLGHDHSHHSHDSHDSHHSHSHDSHHSHSHDSHHIRSHNACGDEDHAHEMEELTSESTSLVPTSPHATQILNINIEGAYLHVMTDLIQSVGVMIAGFVIWLKPTWLVVDLLCTLVFSIFALSTTVPMLKKTFSILMERTPSEIDLVSLENGLKDMKGVVNVHDVHVWAITSGKYVLACHVVSEAGVDSNEILLNIREFCEKGFRICHVTVQIEQRL